MKEETFNVVQAIKAQVEYCSKNGYPHFAPLRGQCFSCHKNIYAKIVRNEYCSGISVEVAGSQLITGCPHCNRTFCD